MRIACRFLPAFLAATCMFGASADTTVKELTHIKGQGESILQGLGLVMGLPGTGDSGKDAPLARPLARVLENNFNPTGDLRELSPFKSSALVMVTCVTPAVAARADDKYDVTVTVIGGASSIKGGVLYLTPLTEPRPGGVTYAIAAGKVELEDPSISTTGKVRDGARIIRDLPTMPVESTFDLVIDPQVAGWSACKILASVINENAQPQGPAIAFAIDERTVRVTIPEHERVSKAKFIDTVMSAPVPTSLLELAAVVICNQRSGVIVVTGDVEISPGIISHKDLVITTTIPAPKPSAVDPLVERSRYVKIDTHNRPKEQARLADLMGAFKQLDIPPSQQIEVLQLLHKTGRLHAKLVME